MVLNFIVQDRCKGATGNEITKADYKNVGVKVGKKSASVKHNECKGDDE